MRGENGLNCFHKVSPNLFHSFCHMTHVHFPQSPRPLRFPSIAPSPRHPSVIPLSALLRLWVAVRENMKYVRNGIVLILILQYAVCTLCAVCKFTLEVPGCPGSFAKMCAREHIVCCNVFNNAMYWPKMYNTQVCECNCFQCARSISFVTHCEMCQAAIHNATQVLNAATSLFNSGHF